jgi:hypothetical protein
MTVQKGLKVVPVQGVSPEQLAALNKWAADYRERMPQVAGIVNVAKDIHRQAVAAPVWRVAEGTPEVGCDKAPEVSWNIGAPKVNYVDHIEVSATDSGESVNERNRK